MHFIKMHGIGNDYIYINGFREPVGDPADLARRVSDRHQGIGGDGLIMLLPPSDGVEADLRMRMFNADGSESEMCGNGIRCACKLAYDHQVRSDIRQRNPMRIETGAGVLALTYRVGGDGRVVSVTVDMGAPILDASRIPVEAADVREVIDHPWEAWLGRDALGVDGGGEAWWERAGLAPGTTAVSMGNPHLVLYVEDAASVPLSRVGPKLETHRAFPRRMNVHFVQVHGPDEVTMRTWERGSGITLACGTGASAVCVAGVLTNRTGSKILAHLPGGDLELSWEGRQRSVMMTGPAVEVFSGVFSPHPD
ncbi:MAG: diaminopimelate epimerase [Phycisphaeraceae bacterium]|nr:diaminopimelate epimerase [Phycisphaeraceae bacterium]